MLDEIKCKPGEPYSGFCGLPPCDGAHGFKCPRCGSLWLPEKPPPLFPGWGSNWRWFRVETRIREAAKVGIRLERCYQRKQTTE